MPFLLLSAIIYIAAVFLFPGWLGIRWLVGSTIGDWFGIARTWVTPTTLIAAHVVIFMVIRFGIKRLSKLYGVVTQYDPAAPAWLKWVWAVISPRGYRWAIGLSAALVSGSLFYLWRMGHLTPEQWCICGASLMGLLDMRGVWVPVDWPGQLPQPRFALDTVPDAEGEGGFAPVTITWNPWLPDGREAAPVSATFAISESEYAEARGEPRFPTTPLTHYTRYVTDGVAKKRAGGVHPVYSVLRVARYLRAKSESDRLQQLDELANAVALVRGIPYETDQNTRGVPDWADYPVELLMDIEGDCEDHAILAAAVLWALGHDVGLFFAQLKDSGHVALAYKTDNVAGAFSQVAADGSQYFYVETVPAPSNERVGDMPASFLTDLKETIVIPVAPIA